MIDMSGWGTIRRVYRAYMDRWWDTVDDPVGLHAPLKELEDETDEELALRDDR